MITVSTATTGIITVYLAGPIDGLTVARATIWRDYLRGEILDLNKGRNKIYTVDVLSPCRGMISPKADADITICASTVTDIANPCNIVSRTRRDIMHSDYIVFYAPEGTVFGQGSCFEFGYALAHRKDIIVVGDKASLPMFMRELCDYHVPEPKDVAPLLQTLLI